VSKIEQSRDPKQMALLEQAWIEAKWLEREYPDVKLVTTQIKPIELSQLLRNLTDEIERLQKIIDERS